MYFKKQKKNKLKIFLMVILLVIVITLVFLIIYLFLFNCNIFAKKETVYNLDINTNNKHKIITLLNNGKTNYCESMYKIEYRYSFPHYEKIKLFCQDDDVIIIYNSNKELNDFIIKNGKKLMIYK